jgi:cytochrome c oxidase assembly protein subunit 15
MEFDFGKRILHWSAVLVAASILLLICSGGLVTSHEAGMAVPDWPNSFGYNMFLFPVSRWVGGVLFEHTHRLIASGVGLLTILLCLVTVMFERRLWVKVLACLAVLAVIIQGVLGGLRVIEHDPLLGLFHGCLAQSFLALVATIALVTSRLWHHLPAAEDLRLARNLRFWAVAVTVMIFGQLVLGAAMRHSHAGLSIPDFPTAYGHLLPPLDAGAVAKINEARAVARPPEPPITVGLILLQYVHRIWAVAILIGLASVAGRMIKFRWLPMTIRAGAALWIGLVLIQFCLGAWTVWSGKAADVATAHVLFGSLTLVTGVVLSVVLSAIVARSMESAREYGLANLIAAARR